MLILNKLPTYYSQQMNVAKNRPETNNLKIILYLSQYDGTDEFCITLRMPPHIRIPVGEDQTQNHEETYELPTPNFS